MSWESVELIYWKWSGTDIKSVKTISAVFKNGTPVVWYVKEKVGSMSHYRADLE